MLTLAEGATVRTLLETAQVPESEVDLVLVNGEAVTIAHVLAEGDRVSIYPVFESLDIGTVTKLPERPLRVTRFVLDTHLGKLCSFLRMLGFDSLYQNAWTDAELVRLSIEEQRVLLSRDRQLLECDRLNRAYGVRATDPQRQLVEVLCRFDLASSVHPFSRCMQCNSALIAVAKEAVIDKLPPKAAEFHNEFVRCPSCDRVYWRGSHYARMARFTDRVLEEVSATTRAPQTS